MKRIGITILATLVAFAAILSGCDATDVVGKAAVRSFEAAVAASGSRAAWSDGTGMWTLSSVEGDEVSFAADFSRNNGTGGPADLSRPDAEFSLDAAPFLAAGLDALKLPRTADYAYAAEDGRLRVRFELGSAASGADAKASFAATMSALARTARARVGYHQKLDHFGVKLGGGNMFEWAKDLSTNDKDLVWVLDPAPFAAAGADPTRIDGWLFAKVESMDATGKPVFEDKLLRPFNLD